MCEAKESDDKNSCATLSSAASCPRRDATCLFGADIDGRRVLNPDNNHLSGTIARCINRVLSPDVNDKRRSLARSGHSILPRSFHRGHSRSFNERIRLQTLPLVFLFFLSFSFFFLLSFFLRNIWQQRSIEFIYRPITIRKRKSILS